MPRAKRSFTPEFKARLVLQILAGQTTQAEACRTHALKPSLLALWKATFLERCPLLFQQDERHNQELARIAELERLVGRQALELEVLKKASALLSGLPTASGRSS
jgi:transposase-like protein